MRDVSSQDSISPVVSRVEVLVVRSMFRRIDIMGLCSHAVILVSARVCRTLGIVPDFLTQLPVRSWGIAVITVKVLAKH